MATMSLLSYPKARQRPGLDYRVLLFSCYYGLRLEMLVFFGALDDPISATIF